MAGHNIEINNLIDEAVKNAAARRNGALLSMTDEEAKSVTGGISSAIGPFITIGLIFPGPADPAELL